MVRQALRPNPSKRQVSQGQSIPAPIGGWDAKNAIAAMPIQNAVILDNWIPRAGYIELRRGFVPQVTGTPGPVESMIADRSSSSGDKLFAASNGGLYDVTTQGSPLGAPVFTGATSNRWNSTAFANAAGAWTVALNGKDAPIGYNAGTWAALPTLSNVGSPTLDPTKLFNGFSHKGRLFFLEEGTLRVWNPAAGAVGGVCTLLDLSSIFSKGGRLICGANWSWQFGITADDFAVFMTDQGQVAIYQGIDPTDATNWSLIGIYDLGPPLGPKALMKYGGDLAVVTADGVIPLSQGLRLDRSQEAQVALTANIMNAFSAAVKAYRGNFGWQGLLYPGTSPSDDPTAAGGSLAIFNIPIATLGASMQYVQNVLTGAWCRFPGFSQGAAGAFCWELANGNVYFGSTAGVYQWDQGSSDNGISITGEVLSAFSGHGAPGREKQYTAVRPLMNAPALVQPALDININYQQTAPTAVPTVIDQGSTEPMIRYDWTSVGSIGYVGAPHMVLDLIGDQTQDELAVGDGSGDLLAVDSSGDTLAVDTNLPFDVPCQLFGFDLIYQVGGQF